MLRIKIPFGGMNARQLEVMAELAEEYSDGIAHITTRQDFQLHFIHIEDSPTIMARLAACGITTREACGNSVRNITGCPIAGVCSDEVFDITPYADAATRFLLGHPDAQDFGRKFKIAFSGCHENGCGLTGMHDLGLQARIENGKRGFRVFVGGGLGAVPQQARLLYEFLPEEELLPLAQAIARVFGRLGEKKNRARARIKFLVQKLGVPEFKKLVEEERKILATDPRWIDFLTDLNRLDEQPLHAASDKISAAANDEEKEWQASNVAAQKQAGYYAATVKLPLGDITADQLRALADITRRYTKETIRTTVEQNFLLRWVSAADLSSLYQDLKAADLAESGAEGIADLVACPGTDTCKLGISASRGLAGELLKRYRRRSFAPEIKKLKIKASGCFNSCSQHHVADLGFYGVSRKVGDYTVPHFQVVLGGQWTQNAGSFGLPIGAVPSKNIPDVIELITEKYSALRQPEESFQAFIKRLGKAEAKKLIEPFMEVPDFAANPEFYKDWGDVRTYTTDDIGIGECAGEVVSRIDFEMGAAERQIFEAQLFLEKAEHERAAQSAYQAMLKAARGLLWIKLENAPAGEEQIVAEFRAHFYDTKIFFDKYAGGKFAEYFFLAHENQENWRKNPEEAAHSLIEESNLFLEAALAVYARVKVKQEEASKPA
jgi:sulfite reductase (ferredoxin)